MFWLDDLRSKVPAGAGRLITVFAFLTCLTPLQVSAAERTVMFRADDGRTVVGTFFDTNRLPAPAVILVPALGHPRDDWQTIAQRFAEQNIAALSIDLPGATAPEDVRELSGWNSVVRGAASWLSAQAGVRPSAIAAAGASLGGTLAVVAAGADPRIHAVAVISPAEEYRGLRLEGALRQVGSRPVLFVVSSRDAYAVRSARELTKDANGPRETFSGEAAASGVRLLTAEPDLARMLVEWFQRTLGVN